MRYADEEEVGDGVVLARHLECDGREHWTALAAGSVVLL